MDEGYEWSCSKEHQYKRRTLKLPKNYSRHGNVEKYYLKSTFDGAKQESNSERGYSLSKKQRWKLLDEFKNDIESFNDHTDVRVSAIEKVEKLVHGKNRSDQNNVKSCHTVDMDGNPVHRYATNTYANADNLMGQIIYPGKKEYRRRWFNKQQNIVPREDEEERKVHIVYEITEPCTSVGLYEKNRRTLNRCKNRWKQPIVRTSLKDIIKDNIINEEDWQQYQTDKNKEELEFDIASDKRAWDFASVDIRYFIKSQRGSKISKNVQSQISVDSTNSFEDINCDIENFEMVTYKTEEVGEEESLKTRFNNNSCNVM